VADSWLTVVAVEEEKRKEAYRLSGRVSGGVSASQGASMSTLRSLRYNLRNLFQRKSIPYGHIQDLQGVPFYVARQPWWARFTWGFIAADLFVT
jgi:hypothetical protein